MGRQGSCMAAAWLWRGEGCHVGVALERSGRGVGVGEAWVTVCSSVWAAWLRLLRGGCVAAAALLPRDSLVGVCCVQLCGGGVAAV